MKTFPIMLDLRGRLAVVVGAGPVGLRKIDALLEAGARVKVVSPQPPPSAAQLKARGVTIIAKTYCAQFLDGALLVFACTDDRALNAQISQDAHWVGAIVNAADQGDDCDFFLPAVAAMGDVVLAVGTGGASPALAGVLRDALQKALPAQIGPFAALLAKIRQELKDRLGDSHRRGQVLKALSSQEAYDAFVAGGEDAVRQRLAELLAQDNTPD